MLAEIEEPKGVVDGLKDFYGVSVTYDTWKDSIDFEHLRKGGNIQVYFWIQMSECKRRRGHYAFSELIA